MKEPGMDKDCVTNQFFFLFFSWVKMTMFWAEPTDPNADADNHGYPGRSVPKRFQRVHRDITAVSTHGSQSDAGSLDCHLWMTETQTIIFNRVIWITQSSGVLD